MFDTRRFFSSPDGRSCWVRACPLIPQALARDPSFTAAVSRTTVATCSNARSQPDTGQTRQLFWWGAKPGGGHVRAHRVRGYAAPSQNSEWLACGTFSCVRRCGHKSVCPWPRKTRVCAIVVCDVPCVSWLRRPQLIFVERSVGGLKAIP